ncbi:hypothetical protein JCM3765_002139 [Sporobolomyces pararoseus]
MYNNSNMQPLYTQQQGSQGGLAGGGGPTGQWGDPNNNQGFSQPVGQYSNYGYSQNGQPQDTLSSANLFQQQLAQQQRSVQNPPPQPSLNAIGGNSYQSSAQAYMQSQQQLAQARQSQIPPSAPSPFPNTSQSPAASSSQLPSQQQVPPFPPQQQPAQQQRQLSGPEIMHLLRGINVNGMNPQIFATLTPIQQYAMREYISRGRIIQAQQQAQLGLGLPGSPVAPSPAQKPFNSSSQPSPLSNGSPAPAPLPSAGRTTQQPTASQIGFLKILGDFCSKRGIPFASSPVVEGRTLELPRLYAAVNATGGFVNTSTRKLWGTVATALGFPAASADSHSDQRLQQIAQAYHTVLYPFEQHVAQMQLERIQAARAAAAAQTPPNGVPPSSQNSSGVTPSQPPTSFASPLAVQNNLPPPVASTSTASNSNQSPRPTSSASASTPAFNNSIQTQIASPQQKTRPNTASSRRESIVAGDIKGKGKAVADTGSLKVEDFATNGTSTPKTAVSVLPEANFSASPRPVTANLENVSKPVASPIPEPPSQPPRRKRQKIEYVPLSKPQENVAGYELAGLEEVLQQATRRKRPRTAYDLGLVDIHSLTMSLRSRLASEVSFALNSLTLISMSIRTHPSEQGTIPFPLSRCRDLYDELVDLLEETAFGYEDDFHDDQDQRGTLTEATTAPHTYPELFQLITEEAGSISPPDPDERNRIAQLADLGHTPLKPVDILVSVTNILRNLSIAEENSQVMGEDEHLLDVLVRIANLPLKGSNQEKEAEDKKRSCWPVRVTSIDSMILKKDVLELITNLGVRVRLENHESSTARSLFGLLSFFLLDADRHRHTYFDLSQTPGSASRLPQPHLVKIAPYLDLGLAAFSQITLLDSNRSTISRLSSSSSLERLFESLIRLVPVSESDFQVLTSESGLTYVQNLIMSLYNLVYLSAPELKLELRKKPAYFRGIMRVIRRLSGTGASDTAAQTFQPLLERCISLLHLLNTLEGVTMGSSGMESSEVPWWGLSMSGWEEEEEFGLLEDGRPRVQPAVPAPAERGTVKQRLPPSASTAAGLDPGLPILSGETMSLFEALKNGSLVNVFPSLVPLL